MIISVMSITLCTLPPPLKKKVLVEQKDINTYNHPAHQCIHDHIYLTKRLRTHPLLGMLE